MFKPIHLALILLLAMFVAVAYSPPSFADKKDKSNSSDSDDKKDRDKDKDKDKDKGKNDQRSQGQGRNRQKNDDKASNAVQQFPKTQQGGSNKQGNSDNQQNKQKKSDKQLDNSDKQKNNLDNKNGSKNSQLILGNGPQGGQSPKSPQGQNFPKQPFPNGSKQGNSQQNMNVNVQKQNIQLQGVKNKPDWIEKSHHDHKDVKNYVTKFGGPQPFSKNWYKDHPKSWHYHHDHDDTWKMITAAGVVGFLGWEAGYHSHPPVVVYQPQPYDTLFVSRPGVIIDPSRGDWMPLGQFSLMLGPGDNSTRMIDLAVDRFGHIRGSYYDMVSGVAQNVAGIIDQRSQYAQWSLESNRGLTFYTPLGELMQPQGLVYVQLPSGERQQWQLVRLDGGGY